MTDSAGRIHHVRVAVERLFSAIESRDLRAVSAALSTDASWQNVPHPPTQGREAVLAFLAEMLHESELVRWEVVSSSFGPDLGWVERVDHFVVEGVEYAVPCNGVFRVHARSPIVTEVRDYVDLGEWRGRVGPVLERRACRTAIDVIRRHLAAVMRRDGVAMAADYAIDATLQRGDDHYTGWASIADYFDTVPARLGEALIEFDDGEMQLHAGTENRASVHWRLLDRNTVVASGTDTYVVHKGRIVEQTVVLDSSDF